MRKGVYLRSWDDKERILKSAKNTLKRQNKTSRNPSHSGSRKRRGGKPHRAGPRPGSLTLRHRSTEGSPVSQ